jgi:hypothetical protein
VGGTGTGEDEMMLLTERLISGFTLSGNIKFGLS